MGMILKQGPLMRAMGFAALALLLLTQGASGQDVLRGSVIEEGPVVMRWAGYYGGAQIGYADARMDFSGATTPLVDYSLRNSALGQTDVSSWDILGTANNRATSFGGFIGFNSQWDDIILGLEANYNRTSLSGVSSGSLSRGVTTPAPDNQLYHTTSAGTGSLNITDYASLRARAGVLYGNALPYLFGGLAVGRGQVDITSTVSGTIDQPDPTPDTPFGPFVGADKRTVYMLGFAAGGGIEMAILPNVFVRAEYEYVKFGTFANMSAQINTVRIGAGLKF